MNETVQAEALAWDERLKRDRSAATRAAFEAWLAADPAHRAEYRQFEALDGLLAASGARASRPVARSRRAPWLALATAAAAALILVIALVGSPFESRPGGPSLASPAAARFTRPVSLADGTLAILDASAVVVPDFDAGRRRVMLRGGAARFLVGPRAGPPLEIVTPRVRARVADGVVEVAAAPADAVTVVSGTAHVSEMMNRQTSSRPVTPGQRLEVATMRIVPAPPPVRLDVLEADRLTLADLLRIANTGGTGPRLVAAPAVGERRVSGRFDVSDRRILARRLAAALGLRVQGSDTEVLLLPT